MSKKPKQRSKQTLAIQSQQAQKALANEVVGIFKQEYAGPLPPPEALAEYGEIIPNGAERIMAMAEAQSKHRRELESRALKTDSRNSLLGVIFAFVLGMTAIIAGVVVVLMGHSWPGTVLGSAGLVGLVSAFIYGTKERRKERESKAKHIA